MHEFSCPPLVEIKIKKAAKVNPFNTTRHYWYKKTLTSKAIMDMSHYMYCSTCWTYHTCGETKAQRTVWPSTYQRVGAALPVPAAPKDSELTQTSPV